MDKLDDFTVYVHISPNNKMYIGITNRDVKLRWCGGSGYSGNEYFCNAINKYGWSNFKHIILFEHMSKDMAICIEEYLIHKYHTNEFSYGYNKSPGGSYYGGSEVGRVVSDTTRAKISKVKKGVHFSDEHKKALSGAWVGRKQKGLGEPWNKGLKLKDTGALDNFIKAGKLNAMKESRPVYQISLNGEIINKFPSVTAGARAVNAPSPEIFGVLAKKRKTARGYMWEYVDVYDSHVTETNKT